MVDSHIATGGKADKKEEPRCARGSLSGSV